MTITTLYLIRHGETNENKNGIVIGSTNAPLNDTGRAQAAFLRDRINALEVNALYSSPLSRAVDTASITFGTDTPIVTDSSLQEFHFGDWENRHFSDISKQYPELWQSWINDWENTEIPGGESFRAFETRVISIIQEILDNCSGQRIAVVSHGGCIRTLMAHFFSASISQGYWQFKVDNASLCAIEFMDRLPILTRFNYR